jgi:hypothetical protein
MVVQVRQLIYVFSRNCTALALFILFTQTTTDLASDDTEPMEIEACRLIVL